MRRIIDTRNSIGQSVSRCGNVSRSDSCMLLRTRKVQRSFQDFTNRIRRNCHNHIDNGVRMTPKRRVLSLFFSCAFSLISRMNLIAAIPANLVYSKMIMTCMDLVYIYADQQLMVVASIPKLQP